MGQSSNILYIARCIFVFDFIDDIPKGQSLEKVSFRPVIKSEQFRISLLSQEFRMGDILLNESKVELDLHDLSVNIDQMSRIVHCSQLLLNVWDVWERDFVCINYHANTGKKICRVYVDGGICEAIYEGKEEITYLANRFQIKYF